LAARIKTGATTWADRSLLASGWYPREVRSAEARLRYYAAHFPLVENDAAYWAVPEAGQVEVWVERTPADFTMNVKAHALMTGHYTDPKRLPKDVRDSLPPALLQRPRVYPRDLGQERMRDLRRRFWEALQPLYRAGKLGVVLFQFPVWFPISRENQEHLAHLRRRQPASAGFVSVAGSLQGPAGGMEILIWQAQRRATRGASDRPPSRCG
jgi:uncharacterized protein YecE (DUF72 family)